MVSILNEKRKVKTKAGRHGAEDKKTNPNFLHMNKLYRVSPHEVLWSWLINTVYYLRIE